MGQILLVNMLFMEFDEEEAASRVITRVSIVTA